MTNQMVLLVSTPHEATLWQDWAKRLETAGFTVHQEVITDIQTLPVFTTHQPQWVIVWLSLPTADKKLVMKALVSQVPEDTIFFSASHEELATTQAAWLPNPYKLVGFSPFGLYRQSNVVTLARTMQGDSQTQCKADGFIRAMQLEPQWIQDTPGMVLPRIYAMLANEAAFALQEGVASAEDIDLAMTLGTNYPQGPLKWADMVGIDTVLRILNHLWAVYKDERYRPCLLLQKMVQSERLGQKSGQGFYNYNSMPDDSNAPKEVQTV